MIQLTELYMLLMIKIGIYIMTKAPLNELQITVAQYLAEGYSVYVEPQGEYPNKEFKADFANLKDVQLSSKVYVSIVKGKPNRHSDLILAWLDGAEIEYMSGDDIWYTCTTPLWTEQVCYRIKQEEALDESTYHNYKKGDKVFITAGSLKGKVAEFTGKSLTNSLVVEISQGHLTKCYTVSAENVMLFDEVTELVNSAVIRDEPINETSPNDFKGTRHNEGVYTIAAYFADLQEEFEREQTESSTKEVSSSKSENPSVGDYPKLKAALMKVLQEQHAISLIDSLLSQKNVKVFDTSDLMVAVMPWSNTHQGRDYFDVLYTLIAHSTK